jgi:hypothetical protein
MGREGEGEGESGASALWYCKGMGRMGLIGLLSLLVEQVGRILDGNFGCMEKRW